MMMMLMMRLPPPPPPLLQLLPRPAAPNAAVPVSESPRPWAAEASIAYTVVLFQFHWQPQRLQLLRRLDQS